MRFKRIVLRRPLYIMTRSIAIFWDYENCRPPPNLPGNKLIGNIRRLVQPLEPIKSFKAYVDLSLEISNPRYATLHSELQSSGVALVHCPHEGRKDVADKMMIVDMLTFAMDNPPPATVAIITGDRDFAYAAAVLKLRGYKIIVIAPSSAASLGLKLQADDLFDWQKDVTGIDGTDGIDNSGVSVISPEAEISIEGKKLDERDLKRSFPSPLNVLPKASSPSLSRSTERSSKASDPLRAAKSQVFESAQASPRNSDSVTGLSTSEMSRNEDSTQSAIPAIPLCEKPPNSALDRVLTAGQHYSEGGQVTVCDSDEDIDGRPCMICTKSSGGFRISHRVTNNEPNVVASVSSPKVEPASNRVSADPDSTTTTPSSFSSYISNTSTTESLEQEVQTPTLRSIVRFFPLIEYFNDQRDIAGAIRMRASTVASALLNRTPSVYRDVGVRGLKQYIEEARLANVIVTPGLDGKGAGWVEINPILYCDPENDTSQIRQRVFELKMSIVSIFVRFRPLITSLIKQRDLLGTRRLRASLVASAMLKEEPNAYEKANVIGMKQYVEEARLAEIILTSACDGGDILIEINPIFEPILDQSFTTNEQVVTPEKPKSTKSMPKLTIDPVFKPLVERLQAEGPSYRMSCSILGAFFKEKYPNWCKLAGISRIKKYVEKAQEQGFVTILDDEWFELVPALRPV